MARRMAADRTFDRGLTAAVAVIGRQCVVHGRESDPGCGGRDDRLVPLVRRRDALGARPARARTCPTPRSSSPTSTAARTSTGSSTRAPATSFGLRSNQATPLRRLLLLAHGRGPRPAPLRRRERRRRSTRGSTMQQRVGARVLPRRAARALRRHARRLASPRSRARRNALHRRRRAAVQRCSPACSRPSSSARVQRARPAADVNDMLRDQARGHGRDRPRGEGARRRATTPARPICRAACEVTDAPVAFLLEPSGPRVRLDRDGRRRHRAGDDPAARRTSESGSRAFTAKSVLRRRRPQPPGARGAAGRGDRRALGACSSRSCATARSPAC